MENKPEKENQDKGKVADFDEKFPLPNENRVGCDEKPLEFKKPVVTLDEKRMSRKSPTTVRLASHEELDSKTEAEWKTVLVNRPRFEDYQEIVDDVFDCNPISKMPKLQTHGNPKFTGAESDATEKFVAKNKVPLTSANAYSLLKYVTERYVHATSGAYGAGGIIDRTALPGVEQSYLELVLERINRHANNIHRRNFNGIRPLMGLELIWSYWMEEGMLVQTMNAISRRFQNLRSGSFDPLGNLTIDPLRPINNLLWGYIQDTQHRLTIARRNYEYEHEYGFRLLGRAVPDIEPAETRSKFIEAFNNLLHRCVMFFDEFDNLVRRPDPFKVLVCLQEVHLILTEGSHNQYGDMPATARVEMLMEQHLLANPVMQQFLGGRPMVAYPQPWMDRVDSMKSLQRWDPVSITYFYELANHGEAIIASIRNFPWATVANATIAGQWAQVFRNQIQIYIHAYRAVTEVDLSTKIGDPEAFKTIPSVLIQRRRQKEQGYSLKRLSGI